jgi:predicted transcriptional regulator
MSLRDELRRILTIISDLTHNDTNSTIKDTQIIAEVNRPSEEVEKYLNELQTFQIQNFNLMEHLHIHYLVVLQILIFHLQQ